MRIWNMRTLPEAALLLSGVLLAQTISTVVPVRYITSAQHLTHVSSGGGCENGDTPEFHAWTPAGGGGNFNGGHVFGMANDGCAVTVPTFNLAIKELTSISPLTVALVNRMTSFGPSATGNCMGTTTHSSKSSTIWSVGDILYLAAFCYDNGSPWLTYKTAIYKSADHGVTWMNWARAQSASPVAQADGDSCTGDTMTFGSVFNCVQFLPVGGINDSSTKFGRPTYIQFAQDGATPPAIAGVDTSYNYFLGSRNTDNTIYCYAYLRSTDPMNPAHWRYWDGTSNPALPATWNTSVANAVTLPAISGSGVQPTAFYSVDYKKFFAVIYDVATNKTWTIYTALNPAGPWTVLPSQAAPAFIVGAQFPSFMLPTYVTEVASARFRIGIMSNGCDITGGQCAGPGWDYSTGISFMDFNLPNVHDGSAVVR
jgi:hypothetical protein